MNTPWQRDLDLHRALRAGAVFVLKALTIALVIGALAVWWISEP